MRRDRYDKPLTTTSATTQLLRASVLCTSLALAACEYPAELSSPISEPGLVAVDERLIGTWYLVSGDIDDAQLGTLTGRLGAEGYLEVAGVFAAVEVHAGGDDGAGLAWLRWTAFPSVIDGETYFNAQLVDSAVFGKAKGEPAEIERDPHFMPHPERGYWIARASISDEGRLVLDILQESDLDLEPRQVDCGTDCSFEVIDLSSEQLVAAIREAEPGALFTQRITLARIQGSYPLQEQDQE